VAATAAAHGYRCLTLDHAALRYEAGGPVAGLLVVLDRQRIDA